MSIAHQTNTGAPRWRRARLWQGGRLPPLRAIAGGISGRDSPCYPLWPKRRGRHRAIAAMVGNGAASEESPVIHVAGPADNLLILLSDSWLGAGSVEVRPDRDNI
jgi:hypothetical protein